MTGDIADLDSYVLSVQDSVYDYFSKTYGTIEPDNTDEFQEKYKDFSHKALKFVLKRLKENNADLSEIKFISKLIRAKFNKSLKPDDPAGLLEIISSLKIKPQLKLKF